MKAKDLDKLIKTVNEMQQDNSDFLIGEISGHINSHFCLGLFEDAEPSPKPKTDYLIGVNDGMERIITEIVHFQKGLKS